MATKVKPTRLQITWTPQVWQVPTYVDKNTFTWWNAGQSWYGRFLSLWNSATWQPISFPEDTPYSYVTWDYFMVNVVSTATPPVNYRPDWSSYTGTASSVTESDEVEIWDVYVYDGSAWLLQSNHWKTVTFANIAWQPTDNLNLAADLNAKQDNLTAWNWIDIDANNKISTTFVYWESSTGASTVQKVVSIPSITELNVWQVIIVKPTVTSTVAASTLKLNDFDAYKMLYNGSEISTSTDSIVWTANVPSMFYLDEVSGTRYWRFLWHWLDSNSTYTLNQLLDAWRYEAWTWTYAITRYSLCMMKPDWTWEKLTATNANYSTAATKNVNTNWFVLNQIKYYNTTTVVAGGAFVATNTFVSQSATVTLAYSFNCGTAPWWSVWDPIYIVWTIWADGLFYLDTTARWSKTLPSTNDWKLYIRIWTALAADNSTASFLQDRPIFYYDNGIKQYMDWYNKQDKSAMVTTLTWADDSHYPTAKAVADAIQWAWGWDMMKSTYDPCNCNDDAFDYCNFHNTPTIPDVSNLAQCCDIPTNNNQLTNGCWYTTCTWTVSTCSDIISKLWYTPYNSTNPNWYTTCTWTLVPSDIANLAQCCDIPTNNNQLTNWCWYITWISCLDVTTALWYTPYSSGNPCNYINNFAGVISALWYTPYNTTNPNWYTTCTGTLNWWDLKTVNGCCLVWSWDICISWWWIQNLPWSPVTICYKWTGDSCAFEALWTYRCDTEYNVFD